MPPSVDRLDHLVLTVRDIAVTRAFYAEVLGMSQIEFQAADGSRRWALRFGRQKLNLHQAGREYAPHAARPVAGAADLCFVSRTSLAQWQAHLAAHGIAIEEGPVARSGAVGPIVSLYLRDPDGNLLEISTPP